MILIMKLHQRITAILYQKKFDVLNIFTAVMKITAEIKRTRGNPQELYFLVNFHSSSHFHQDRAANTAPLARGLQELCFIG